MHPARDSRPILLGLCAFLILAGGCNMVGDLTGVSVNRANPTSCIASCAHSSADQVQAEAQAHQTAVRNCQGLSESERPACIAAEASRHAAAMAQIASGRLECMNSCHRQGSGSAG